MRLHPSAYSYFLLLSLCASLHSEELKESYRTALVDYKSGQFAEAAVVAQKAVEESPTDARPLLLRGRISTALKHYEAAEKDFHAALKLDHGSNLGYLYLGDLFFAQRSYDAARIHYASYHRQNPADPDGVLKLIYCALGSKDLPEADRLAQGLNFSDEKNPSAYFAAAAIAQQSNNKADSDKFLLQAQTIYGNYDYGHYLVDYLFLFALPSAKGAGTPH